jgi:hypothetical protein
MSSRPLRIALALQIAGLALEFVSIVHLRPLTFMGFVGIGVPMILAGAGLYLGVVVRSLVRSGAL